MIALIGVDCATDPKKVGAALATWDGQSCKLDDVLSCSPDRPPVKIVSQWMAQASVGVLLCLDAPLGWPEPLGTALKEHCAGSGLSESAHRLFRRDTDRAIYERTGKTPLDVGADRIARTAHWALSFLDALRAATGESIPLCWSPREIDRACAIEVYPAATLLAHGATLKGYKAVSGASEREAVFRIVASAIDCHDHAQELTRCSDTLDAGACVLAGVDFIRGIAVPPRDEVLAKKEGWIWARSVGG